MANTFFKPFSESDRTSSRTLLHEVIPITGTLISGTYDAQSNVKSFSHGMFKSVYDYPFLSSSANHIFDVSFGYHASSSFSGSSNIQHSKKLNMYSQMAQILSGYDTNGKLRRFDKDGDFSSTGDKHNEAWFLTLSRLLVKDEIKKGSFSLSLATGEDSRTNTDTSAITITDTGAESNYKLNSPAGEYSVLSFADVASSATFTFNNAPDAADQVTITVLTTATSASTATLTAHGSTTNTALFSRGGSDNGAANFKTCLESSGIKDFITVTIDGQVVTVTQKTAGTAGNLNITSSLSNVSINGGTAGANGAFKGGRDGANAGLLYYQAGVVVLTGSILGEQDTTILSGSTSHSGSTAHERDLRNMATGSTIDALSDAFLHRVTNMQFNNTTELNSTIYFCRANHNEFNYSSNPTYLSNSKIRVKGDNNLAPPRSYVTTVGMYSADNELLAVAKLSEPLRKDPTNELTLRVRLDY